MTRHDKLCIMAAIIRSAPSVTVKQAVQYALNLEQQVTEILKGEADEADQERNPLRNR
jgi:predicted transcriptional regulator